MKEKVKILCLILIVIVVVLFPIVVQIGYIETNSNIAHDLSKIYYTTTLKQFTCSSVTSDEDDKEIYVHFILKVSSPYALIAYSSDECAEDIAKIKRRTETFISKNFEGILKGYRVTLSFQMQNGESYQLYNYCVDEFEIYDVLTYMDYIEVEHISVLDEFQKISSIRIKAEKIDSLIFFEEWKDLEYLELYTSNMTEEQKAYLKEILPNCEILVNNEILQQCGGD